MTKSPSDADRHIGSRIRARRVVIGMSQEKLGDELGVTFQQVQKYEKGANRVGAGRLLQIGTILKVPVTYFYDGIESDSARSTASGEPNAMTILESPEGIRLAKAFVKIKNRELSRKVVELIETMGVLKT